MESILATNDYVGISFWLATAIMLASTVFFFVERSDVKGKWKTSMTVAGLVTGVAFWHYLYMREVWVVMGDTPTVYRYIDWLITVPLQIIEFYLVIAAVTAISAAIFWKLLIASILISFSLIFPAIPKKVHIVLSESGVIKIRHVPVGASSSFLE